MNYLFPRSFKRMGWILLFPSFIFGLFLMVNQFPTWEFFDWQVFAFIDEAFMGSDSYFKLVKNNVIDEITGTILLIGLVLVAFSKEKVEDEFISKIRVESLVWATYVNYAVLLVSILFVYGGAFFSVLIFNLFTILFFFIIRFNWMLHKSAKTLVDEK